VQRALDVFDRVTTDRKFAEHIKVLRMHWTSDDETAFNLMNRECECRLRGLRLIELRFAQVSSGVHYPSLQPSARLNG
jgi:hypothetical protein